MSDDFSRLYAQLGLRDGCNLDEFKQACRRRIRDQHPDRLHVVHHRLPDESQIPLVELLPLYAKALRFHRRHGRLPGAPVPATAPACSASSPHASVATTPPAMRDAPQSLAARLPSMSSGLPADQPTRSLRGALLVSLGVVATLALVGNWSEQRPSTQDEAGVEASLPDAVPAPLGDAPARLEVGMDEDTVRTIQGEPLQWNGAEWIYGPSWLRFEDGYLIDWYSSPLHPLATRTRTPVRD